MTPEEKYQKLLKLADNMYSSAFNLTTDASLLRKAMNEFRSFRLHEGKSLFTGSVDIDGWIARDRPGQVYLFWADKPTKEENRYWDNKDMNHKYISERLLPKSINPQWEDDEPVKVCITISV